MNRLLACLLAVACLPLCHCRTLDEIRGMNESRDRENVGFSVALFNRHASYGYQPYSEPILDPDGSKVTDAKFTGRIAVYYYQYKAPWDR